MNAERAFRELQNLQTKTEKKSKEATRFAVTIGTLAEVSAALNFIDGRPTLGVVLAVLGLANYTNAWTFRSLRIISRTIMDNFENILRVKGE